MRFSFSGLRTSARSLVRDPAFTLPVVILLGIAIGTNAAMFAFVDGILLEPLPLRQPERLVLIWAESASDDKMRMSAPDLVDLERSSYVFEALAAFAPWGLTLTEGDDPERIATLAATPNLFQVLGVEAEQGRTFGPQDASVEDEPVVVLSHRFWRTRLASAEVVGKRIELDERPHRVLGVLPPEMTFPTSQAALWIPLGVESFGEQRDARWLQVVGRLAEGRSRVEASEELAAIATGLAAEHPATNRGWTLRLESLHEMQVRAVRPGLLALQGAVLLLLLIACINLASLILARGESRRQELAVRASLGASLGTLSAQLALEGLLLAAAGGALGLFLARLLLRGMLQLIPRDLAEGAFENVAGQAFPRLEEVAIGPGTWLFTLGLSLAIAALLTLVPLRGFRRSNLRSSLVGEAYGGPRGRALRRALVVAEIALALALLVGSGLLIRSFWSVLEVDPGFEPEGVLTMELSVGRFRDAEQRARIIEQLLDNVATLPGVEEVGFSTTLPFTQVDWEIEYSLPEAPPGADGERTTALYHAASPGYFSALRIPVLEGRPLAARDRVDAPPVVVINRTLARRHWPGKSPVGRRIALPDESEAFEIVGVVGDTYQRGLDVPVAPEIFTSFAQRPPRFMKLAIRGHSAEPEGLIEPVKEKLREVLPALPVRNARPLAQLVSESTADRRFSAALAGQFALVALVLALIGVYSVLSYLVLERRRELGLRMALGATHGQVRMLVLREGLTLAALGAAGGVFLALSIGRLLRGLLYGVEAADPLTFTVIVLLLVAATLIATYLPARRATRLEPRSVLSEE